LLVQLAAGRSADGGAGIFLDDLEHGAGVVTGGSLAPAGTNLRQEPVRLATASLDPGARLTVVSPFGAAQERLELIDCDIEKGCGDVQRALITGRRLRPGPARPPLGKAKPPRPLCGYPSRSGTSHPFAAD
jgi:hypothetical protein